MATDRSPRRRPTHCATCGGLIVLTLADRHGSEWACVNCGRPPGPPRPWEPPTGTGYYQRRPPAVRP